MADRIEREIEEILAKLDEEAPRETRKPISMLAHKDRKKAAPAAPPRMQRTAMGRDTHTPAWVQHIAFKVESEQVLIDTKARLEAAGIDVIGVTDHVIFKSIYFFDPNGHRLELATDTATPEMSRRLDEVKWAMLDEWSRTKRAPKHAAWLHQKELAGV